MNWVFPMEYTTRSAKDMSEKWKAPGYHPNITVGARPSGVVHLGNMATLGTAFCLGEKIKDTKPFITFTVCDLDIPEAVEWNASEMNYVKYFGALSDPDGCHENLLDHSMSRIREYLDGLSEITGIPYRERPLSKAYRDLEFRKGLVRLLDDPATNKLVFPEIEPSISLAYPLCPSCETAYTGSVRGKKNTYDPTTHSVNSWCFNPECRIDQYNTDILDTSQNLTVHLMLAAIRDSLVHPLSDIHVYGGDYASPHASNRLSKIEKITLLTKRANRDGLAPDVLISPLITHRGNEKMGKSLGNGFKIDQVKSMLGPNYIEKVYDFVRSNADSNRENIPYGDLFL
jgi:hypothetical protein